MRLSLKNKLMLFFSILVIVPLMVGNIIQYTLNNRATREHMQQLNRNNARLAGAAVDNAMQSIFTFSQYLGVEQNIVNFLNARTNEEDALWRTRSLEVISMLSTSNNYLASICLLATDGRTINRGGPHATSIEPDEAQKAAGLQGYYFWGTDQQDSTGGTLYLCRMLRNMYEFSDTLGYVKVSVSVPRLADLLSPPENYPDTRYIITDETGGIVLSSGSQALLSDDSILLAMEEGRFGASGDGVLEDADYGKFYVAGTDLTSGWQLYSIMSTKSQANLLPELFQVLFIETILCFIFCMLLAQLFTAYTVKPLDRLGKLMQRVGEGDFSVQFEGPLDMEIQKLADEFNQMSRQLNVLYNQAFASELEVMRSRLAEMEAKINPHFLYNCLDTIYWTAQMGKNEEVSGMVSALSKLFHMALSMDNSGLVSLSDELDYLRCYCTILYYRFGDDIEFDLEVDESLKGQTVSRFVLQPIVENAVTHGLHSQPGVVHVQVCREEDCIVYRVSDTGGTVDPEEVDAMLKAPEEQLEGTRGFALRNINSRIQIRFGKAYGLCCYRQNGLSVFEVRQPYQGGKRNHDQAVDC